VPERRILVKLRPSTALRAAEARVNLRPLHDGARDRDALLGIGTEARWFLADLPDSTGLGDGAAHGAGWDLAHARIADQLGVAPSDVIFAEPDLIHSDVPPSADAERPEGIPFALADDCGPKGQETGGGRARGPDVFGWHLEDDFSQLASARDAVAFRDPRTRIAHLDTGYWPAHEGTPAHVRRELARNFVEAGDDGEPGGGAEDPGRTVRLIDNSGHGTGTLGILAGKAHPGGADRALGGAPEAEVVPLRIAPRVVLLRTSSFARALRYALDHGCDVATMSMGGLPSRAWRETVDDAYVGGMCIVSAAGNNFAGLPTPNLVYPARYGRVIAVAGVMADGRPYSRLGLRTMQGNHGPRRHMLRGAMAAYTPNIPWARMGCEDLYRLNGAGTSSATPQVAAAAALWFEKHKDTLPRSWRRVEAVRHALFSTARGADGKEQEGFFGNGILRAFDALAVPPEMELPATPRDRDSFAFLRVITGLGITEATLSEEMFNLELMQRWVVNPRLHGAVEDPEAEEAPSERTLETIVDAILEDEGASSALKRHVADRWSAITGRRTVVVPRAETPDPGAGPIFDHQPELRNPPVRKLRVFAKDPSFAGQFDRAGMAEATIEVRWEDLHRGPIGEYIAVRDTAPEGGRAPAVDLDDPRLLARHGWAPSEGNRHFHQQMVYAVAMKTIEHFESALGRPVLWNRDTGDGSRGDADYVQHLTIRPHHVQQANAYYSPKEVALHFGYFDTQLDDPRHLTPGSRIYTCLSHDIIAHETTHAILDGMQRRFREPTNPDVLAFHEAFADLVALMQHFSLPGVVESEIARTRGDLQAETVLGSLALQFGRATGRGEGLREAIGRREGDRWVRNTPDPTALERRHTPHARGAILVAAVFDAFLAIYRARTADLYRIYTGGTGVLAEGAIHPDLVGRLAQEATRAASHVLTMCIRALDYLPPVDVTFFEYLRALITADSDAVPQDGFHYRVAFVEAFRRWGIFPIELREPGPDTPRTLSVDTIRWRGLESGLIAHADPAEVQKHFGESGKGLRDFANGCFYLLNRKELFEATTKARKKLRSDLANAFGSQPKLALEMGLDPDEPFEVHELRPAMRISPEGRHVPQVVVSLTQSVSIPADEANGVPAHTFHGGSTLIVDLSERRILYRIVKQVTSKRRRARTARFLAESHADPLRRLYLGREGGEPFALLHGLSS
jgi:hypothetical protein